ncbi:MAG: sulfotransferase family protein [Nocardioides sp.]
MLVTGAGRSGTSTIAGALSHLGLHVPQPVLKPNASNPQGFFEPTWSVRFHNRLMERAMIAQTDARPEAYDLVAESVRDEERDALRAWISGLFEEASQVVVKDPRSLWVPWLWEQTTDELGVQMGFLTMVRHPAEVVGSRSTYYGAGRAGVDAWTFRVGNLCAWINGNLGVERQTRAKRRVVVRYNDLISDWRSVVLPLADAFDLSLAGADGAAADRLDEFIDPTLRRHEPTWDGMDMPAELAELAEGVYGSMCALADSDGRDDDAHARMDDLWERYSRHMMTAQAVARDTTLAAARSARRSTETEVRDQMREKVRRARRVAQEARAEADRASRTFGTRVDRAVRTKVPGPVKRALRRLRRS